MKDIIVYSFHYKIKNLCPSDKFYSNKIKLKYMRLKGFLKYHLDENVIIIIILLIIMLAIIVRDLLNCKDLLACILENLP